MARRVNALDVWMNGHYVGQWDRHRAGVDRLTYDPEWMASPQGRPLSLSLPFAFGHDFAILDKLRGSERAEHDRAIFFRAQLVFWLMAATDGHAKNFSIHLLPGGRYQLAPLYDILSTYPIHGRGPHQLDPHKARLSMAVRRGRAHYRLHDIHRWHWVAMAEKAGLTEVGEMLDELVQRVPAALQDVSHRLPARFPVAVFDAVAEGMQQAATRLAREAGNPG